MYQLRSIKEVLYSVGNLEKVKSFFCDYGGWNEVGTYQTTKNQLDFWQVSNQANAEEVLIQSDHHPTGQLRLVKFNNIDQDYIRSSQQPWDTGGIMDINLRVHEVANTFDELRELGWHGLSDPLFQKMGTVELYDILMKGYDDTIIAYTHRVQPPMELKSPIKFPTHVYNSSITVKDIEKAKQFYIDTLGCKVLMDYEVKKEKPQESMFGFPHNLTNKVNCKAVMLSYDGERDTMFQICEFEGATGKDFSAKAKPPNKGFMSYRVSVDGVSGYYNHLQEKEISIHQPLQQLDIQPYGKVNTFSVICPDGVLITFIEE